MTLYIHDTHLPKIDDELNHFRENGEVTLVTQPVVGDKQKVIAGTGAQLFKKLVESATHGNTYYIHFILLMRHLLLGCSRQI